MKTVLAVLVLLIITLGLIAGPVNQQVAGIRDAGESGKIEMNRVTLISNNSDYVTGNVVKNDSKLYSVIVRNKYDETMNVENDVLDKAVFKKTVIYDANGDIALIQFDQIDLSY